MKKLLVILTATVVCIALSVPSALAGSKQRHRWEGVAIGLGQCGHLRDRPAFDGRPERAARTTGQQGPGQTVFEGLCVQSG